MKLLDGRELAGYIKERHAKAVRGLRQAWQIQPKLAIIVTKEDSVIDKYVSLKEKYAADILVDVEVYRIKQVMLSEILDEIKKDKSIHGVIVQLPLDDVSQTEQLLNLIPPSKDVDGLGNQASYDSATATAISWLLTGYNVELEGKQIVVNGNGRLVGAPLAKMWQGSGLNVKVLDSKSFNPELIKQADVIVSATGRPGIITEDIVAHGAIVVDAGTASESGKIVGDVNDNVYARDDLTITPKIGGVGPLTIAALFENVITAARGTKGRLDEEL